MRAFAIPRAHHTYKTIGVVGYSHIAAAYVVVMSKGSTLTRCSEPDGPGSLIMHVSRGAFRLTRQDSEEHLQLVPR